MQQGWMFFVIGLTMAIMQGGYVRRLPEHKIKPTAVLVSTLVTACSSSGVNSSCHNTKHVIPRVRFQVLTAVRIMMLLFWVLMLCRLVGRYQRFGETSSALKI
jgi:hypothetical protein